jgi:hypothetical protein
MIRSVAFCAAPGTPCTMPDRSTGLPKPTTIRGRRATALASRRARPPLGAVYGTTSCAPHWATGTTGAPVASARRAAPVLPRSGHMPGSRPMRPSG